MGVFDLAHLRAIHRHMFQDVYEWAGELRTVEISKDGRQFQFRRYVETGFADIHRRLESSQFLAGLGAEAFAVSAGTIMGDINYVHSFREGNGRAQCFYLEQLAGQAGHILDLTRLNPSRWLAASRESHAGNYATMVDEIRGALGK